MDSNSSVGNVTTYYILTTDGLGEEKETNISKGFTVNPETTYAQVDTASRAIANIMTNTYQDTILVTKISVNEIMAV